MTNKTKSTKKTSVLAPDRVLCPATINQKGRTELRLNSHRIIAADFESTEAKFGLIPEAFCAGALHEDGFYVSFWDDKAEDYIGEDYDYFRADSAANQLFDYFDTLTEPHVIYFHNGGRFDIQYFAHRLPSQSVVYVGSRAVAVTYGIHEIRDSASIVAVKLSDAGAKGTIQLKTHVKAKRNKNRREILGYLRQDCRVLMKAVTLFLNEACPVARSKIPMTISSAAFKALCRIEEIPMRYAKGKALEISRSFDAEMRPYYVGGHVEYFEGGILEGDFKLYDVNSMYPFAMAHFKHPVSDRFDVETVVKMTPDFWIEGFENVPYFLEFEGTTVGLPSIVESEGTQRNEYAEKTGLHKYHSHELRVALEFGLVNITKIIAARLPKQIKNFSKYVYHYYEMRQELARRAETGEISADDYKALDTIAKLYLNGPYGKFAFNYRNYKTQHYVNYASFDKAEVYAAGMTRKMEVKDIDGDIICAICETDEVTETYYNVSTAASITAAARGLLLRAIMTCKRPIYCDTDSLLCETLNEVDGIVIAKPKTKNLGEWGLDTACDKAVIAGRKLYALYKNGNVVKVAGKGYTLMTDRKEQGQLNEAGRLITNSIAGEKTVIKAPFMGYKLGSKQRPTARTLQADKRVLKLIEKLRALGIETQDQYKDETETETGIVRPSAWRAT